MSWLFPLTTVMRLLDPSGAMSQNSTRLMGATVLEALTANWTTPLTVLPDTGASQVTETGLASLKVVPSLARRTARASGTPQVIARTMRMAKARWPSPTECR